MKRYDVVIVGSGVAGALTAASLARAGAEVLVLEAGPWNPVREELLENYYAAKIKIPESPYPENKEAPRPKSFGDDYYQQVGSHPFQSTYERCVGGTTWHWLGTCPRFLPEDFSLKSRYGKGVDWPITYPELETWYCRAEKELGVACDNRYDFGSPRTEKYPKPPLQQTYLDNVLAKSIRGKSFEKFPLDILPSPQARDPEVCMGSTSCIPICPTGAKYEAVRHIQIAIKHGATVLDKAIASRIDVGAEGDITGIEYHTWDKQKKRVEGQIYVIAANAMETPRLLLMSASNELPDGVANRSGLVGKNLMDHPLQLSWALAKEPIYPFRGPVSTSGIENLRGGAFRKLRGAFRVQISNDGWSWPTGAPNSTATMFAEKGLTGKELRENVKNHIQRQLQVLSTIEQLPDEENRITLSTTAKDAMGFPKPELHYFVKEYERNGIEASKRLHDLLFDCLRTSEKHHHSHIFGSGHIMGTCRMGNDASNSVLNSRLQSHDHPNLYLLGAGCFPTGGTANPTLTIAALSLRAAERIARELKRIHT